LDGSTGGLPANLRLIAAAIVVICSQSRKNDDGTKQLDSPCKLALN